MPDSSETGFLGGEDNSLGEWWRQRLGVAVVAIMVGKVLSRRAILLELGVGDFSATYTALISRFPVRVAKFFF